jgi:hypothetical protein
MIDMNWLQLVRHTSIHTDTECVWTWRRMLERTNLEWKREVNQSKARRGHGSGRYGRAKRTS